MPPHIDTLPIPLGWMYQGFHEMLTLMDNLIGVLFGMLPPKVMGAIVVVMIGAIAAIVLFV